MPTRRSEVPFDDHGKPGAFGPGLAATEKARHRSAKRAYREGRQGKPFSMETADALEHDQLREFYEQGRGDRLERQPAPPVDENPSSAGGGASSQPPPPSAAPTPMRSSGPRASTVAEGAGVLLGALVYALVMNYLQGGISQARGWVGAKFVNRPWKGTRTAPATPSKPSAPNTATPSTPSTPTHLVTTLTPHGAG